MDFSKNLQLMKFKEINLEDPFFESLLKSYSMFANWFNKKSEELAYVMIDEHQSVQAFLYLKREEGEVTDITPNLPNDIYLKVGTFKINPHGTRLGERFVKKIFDTAISNNINKIYVTIFPEHVPLIELLRTFGFRKISEKKSEDGIEDVYLKDLQHIIRRVEDDYPVITLSGSQYLLGIYPDYHTRLFPDSILFNENVKIIDDVSYTNSIEKIYICRMNGVENLVRGDSLVIYRTKDNLGPAWYRAVATSLCMVEEVVDKGSFKSEDDFLSYCASRSVFSVQELKHFYNSWSTLYAIRMTYNGALQNRIIRKRLVEEVGLNPDDYWGFMPLTKIQYKSIAKMGGIDDSLIID